MNRSKYSIVCVGVGLIAVGCGARSVDESSTGETPRDDTQAVTLQAPPSAAIPCDTSTGYPCASDEFCQAKTGACDMKPGVCRPKPQSCNHTYKPVCGCDGHTYPNQCVAALYGASVRKVGPCQHTEQVHLTPADERDTTALLKAHRVAFPTDAPYFCYGYNETVNQCMLYAATEEFCDTVRPCWSSPRGSDDTIYTRFPQEADTYCQGWDEDTHQCQTYFGTEEMCNSLEPCSSVASIPTSVAIQVSDPYWCYGFDEDTNQCYLYYGSKAMCDTLTPCW